MNARRARIPKTEARRMAGSTRLWGDINEQA
jgi:hypothetical protein